MKFRNRSISVWLASLALYLGAFGAAHANVLLSGNTSASTPTSWQGGLLTYTSATFSGISVPEGVSTALPDLGTFKAYNCGSNGCTTNFDETFTLTVTFTDPIVAGGSSFSADIGGQIKRSGMSANFNNGTSLAIDFTPDFVHLTYTNALGSGAFDLYVFDKTLFNQTNSSGDEAKVSGEIRNLTFTATTPVPRESNVPAPATVALLGIGLVGLAAARRRKEQ